MMGKVLLASVLVAMMAVAIALPTQTIEVDIEFDGSSKQKPAPHPKPPPHPKPHPKPHPQPSPPSPAPEIGTCGDYTISGECIADKCCNWCNLAFNTSEGFCMNTLPYQMPGLTCMKETTVCEKLSEKKDCDGLDQCAWVPMGKTGFGVCVYELDGCKTPKKPPHPKPHPHPTPAPTPEPTPKPTPKPHPPMDHSCNSTTAHECNLDECCHWCHEAPSLTEAEDDKPKPTPKPGFCMKIGGFPIPTLTCSKQKEGDCKDHASAKSCKKHEPLCSWISFGPPGAKGGPGMCSFNWTHCTAPKPPPGNYERFYEQTEQ